MNKIQTITVFIITFLLFSSGLIFAEDSAPKTLFGDFLSISGYGGVSVEYARLNDETYGWLTGGRGAVIIDDTFAIGGFGKMFVQPTKRAELTGTPYSGEEPYVHLGYGGLLLEYHLNPKDLVHLSVGVLAGVGGVSYSPYSIEDDEFDTDADRPTDIEAFVVVEPEVTLLINLTRFCRAGLGVSYRYPYGLDGNENAAELTDSTLQGFNGILQIQFGWF
ncbi:MAG: hypothetical protein JXB03_02475 [Spirochaetales bacterium]|nr:hypothetical protein [Spirochaetales bacterium]